MKPSVLIAVALILGAIAAFMVSKSLGIGGSASNGPTVVIAGATINPGVVIAPGQMKTMAWGSPILPEGSFNDPAKLSGRVAKQPISAGEPITESKLAAADSRGGLSSVITPGKRAISVRVNDVIAVAGFTLPGSFVDVMVNTRDANDNPRSRIILNRVKVLAIAQETSADQNKPKVVNAVTLELSPEESEVLDLARSVGTLSLVLRNEMDREEVASPGSRLSDLVGGGPVSRSATTNSGASSSSYSVELIRGTNRSRVEVSQ
jgi:pilus assembly protein CpaB